MSSPILQRAARQPPERGAVGFVAWRVLPTSPVETEYSLAELGRLLGRLSPPCTGCTEEHRGWSAAPRHPLQPFPLQATRRRPARHQPCIRLRASTNVVVGLSSTPHELERKEALTHQRRIYSPWPSVSGLPVRHPSR